MNKPQSQKQLERVEKKRHRKKVLSIALVVIVCFVGVLLAIFTPSLNELLEGILYALNELLEGILYALPFSLVLLVFVMPVALILFIEKFIEKRHRKKVLSIKVLSIALVVIVCFVGVLLAIFTHSLNGLLFFTLGLLVFVMPSVMPVAFILFFVKDAAKKTRFLLIFLGVSLGGCFGYWLDGRGFLILDWLSLLAESSPEFRGRGPGYYINSISLSFGYLLGGVVVGGLVAFLLTKPKEPTLAKAASRGNIEAAQKHIAAGTGVNAKDNDVTTTLDSADAGTVDLLCKHGDKNKKEQKTVGKSDDESCRSVPSLETQHSEPVSESSRQEPLMAKSSNSEADRALFDAAKAGNIEAFKQHLAAGADVNVKGSTLLGQDVAPLHEAAGWGHKEVVELLIAKGADVNAKDAEGKTPLDSGTGATADLLRKRGGKTGEELKAEGK
jgi:thiamine transporter ThiT